MTIVLDSVSGGFVLAPNLAANGSKPQWKPRKRKVKKEGRGNKRTFGTGG
jgi:hypothetical protein